MKPIKDSIRIETITNEISLRMLYDIYKDTPEIAIKFVRNPATPLDVLRDIEQKYPNELTCLTKNLIKDRLNAFI